MTYVSDHGEAPGDLLVCEVCLRDVTAGGARKHEQRFHNGAPVVVGRAARWQHVEKRLQERRQRIQDGLDLACRMEWDRRQKDRRHVSF